MSDQSGWRIAGKAFAFVAAVAAHGCVVLAAVWMLPERIHGTVERMPVAIVLASEEPPEPDPKPEEPKPPEPVKPEPVREPDPPPPPPPPAPVEPVVVPDPPPPVMDPPPPAVVETPPDVVVAPPPPPPVPAPEPPKPVEEPKPQPPEPPKPAEPPPEPPKAEEPQKPVEPPKETPKPKVEPKPEKVRPPEKHALDKPKVAPKPDNKPTAPPATAVAPKVGIAGTAGDPAALANYDSSVNSRLNAHKRYPDAARPLRAQGTVTVRFTIGPSGDVSGVAIVGSSGNAALDQAALAMVRDASPMPAPPGGKSRPHTFSAFFHML